MADEFSNESGLFVPPSSNPSILKYENPPKPEPPKLPANWDVKSTSYKAARVGRKQ